MRRVAAVVAVLVGATLIVFTFGEHLFSRSSDAQTIADHYQPLMSRAGLADLTNGFDDLQAAGGQLDTQAEPQLQRALGLDDRQFAAYKTQHMPGIAQFDKTAPAVVALVGPVIAQMDRERGDYHRASDIPVSWLPLTSAPWLFLGIGALLVGIGAVALVRPNRLAIAALFVAGLGVAIAPVVVGIPGKVDAAVRVTRIGKVGLAPATAQHAVAATKLFDGMASDVHTTLEPALAAGANRVDPATAYPTLVRWADEWQRTTSAKSHALSDSQVRYGPTFASANRIPLRPIPWLFIAPGALLALLAGAGLLVSRREPALGVAPQPVPASVS